MKSPKILRSERGSLDPTLMDSDIRSVCISFETVIVTRAMFNVTFFKIPSPLQ